jgi:hypothetical protein
MDTEEIPFEEDEIDVKSLQPFILKTKIEDMIKYGKKAVASFPRRERQTADEIRQCMLTMYRLVIRIEKKHYKKTTLQDLDIELDTLRHLIRLAHDKDYYDERVPKRDSSGRPVKVDGKTVYTTMQPPLSMKKYEYWSSLLTEIGKILGGYIKAFK